MVDQTAVSPSTIRWLPTIQCENILLKLIGVYYEALRLARYFFVFSVLLPVDDFYAKSVDTVKNWIRSNTDMYTVEYHSHLFDTLCRTPAFADAALFIVPAGDQRARLWRGDARQWPVLVGDLARSSVGQTTIDRMRAAERKLVG